MKPPSGNGDAPGVGSAPGVRPGVGSAPSVDAGALLAASPLDALDARVLLCHALGWRRTELITRAHMPLDATAVATFKRLEARRDAGEPVAQLVGEREFYGRRFAVTPAVLIPRPDTELLVELALADLDRRAAASADAAPHRPLRMLDLGTGSGAIAVTIAAERPATTVVATDRSTAALAVARANAAALLPPGPRAATRLDFRAGDWFDALDGAVCEPFDLIVSNPPYIAATDPHLETGDLRFEPRAALTDDGDGLGAIRAIVGTAACWLRAGGALMIEHGYDQGPAVRQLFRETGWEAVATARDLGDRDRVTYGRTASLPPGATPTPASDPSSRIRT